MLREVGGIIDSLFLYLPNFLKCYLLIKQRKSLKWLGKLHCWYYFNVNIGFSKILLILFHSMEDLDLECLRLQ